MAPEVTVTTGQLNNVGIRGIRTGSYGPTLDSANAVYLDGNYNARFTSLNGLFFDVARVEVLDGPQGTLYGRNSAGGAMNIISNKPTQTLGGYGWVELGNYNTVAVNGAINVPFSDTLSARIAVMRDSHSGFDSDSGTDDQDLQGYRALLQWKTSTDSLLLTAQASITGGKEPAPIPSRQYSRTRPSSPTQPRATSWLSTRAALRRRLHLSRGPDQRHR